MILIQFVKFLVVGCINTGLHYAVFYTLYTYLGVYYLLASTIGYSVGLVNSYVLNRTWTFRSQMENQKAQFARFIGVNFMSLAVNLGALKLFVAAGGLPPELSQVLAIAFSLMANFIGNKFWTFRSGGGEA